MTAETITNVELYGSTSTLTMPSWTWREFIRLAFAGGWLSADLSSKDSHALDRHIFTDGVAANFAEALRNARPLAGEGDAPRVRLVAAKGETPWPSPPRIVPPAPFRLADEDIDLVVGLATEGAFEGRFVHLSAADQSAMSPSGGDEEVAAG